MSGLIIIGCRILRKIMDWFVYCEIGYGYLIFLFVFIGLNLFSFVVFLFIVEFG